MKQWHLFIVKACIFQGKRWDIFLWNKTYFAVKLKRIEQMGDECLMKCFLFPSNVDWSTCQWKIGFFIWRSTTPGARTRTLYHSKLHPVKGNLNVSICKQTENAAIIQKKILWSEILKCSIVLSNSCLIKLKSMLCYFLLRFRKIITKLIAKVPL